MVGNLFFSNKLGNLYDDVHCLFHIPDGNEFVSTVEVQPAGEDVGAGQSFEGELRTVGTAADGLHVGFHAYGFHSGESHVDDVHHRFYLLAHVVVLVAEFERCRTFTVFGVDFTDVAFYLFLALFEAWAIVSRMI